MRPDEIDGLNDLLEQALTFPIGNMAPWTAGIGHEYMRAVRRDGRAVAGMSIIPMGHYFGGQSVRAGGITAVGVAPEQRGSGVGRWMLQQSLEELHRQGVPLATLYPATTAFYRRTGFERAAQRLLYDVPLAAIGVRDYTLEAVPAGPASMRSSSSCTRSRPPEHRHLLIARSSTGIAFLSQRISASTHSSPYAMACPRAMWSSPTPRGARR